MNIEKGADVRELFNTMANSHELLLKQVLKKKGIKFKTNWSFRKTIAVFEKEMNTADQDSEIKQLISNLYQLDSDWTFVKHGNHTLNPEGRATFIKDERIREFDDGYMKRIKKQFSDDQIKLCNIANKL